MASSRERENIRADPRSWDSGARAWSGQEWEHDADHGEADEGCDGSGVAFEGGDLEAALSPTARSEFSDTVPPPGLRWRARVL